MSGANNQQQLADLLTRIATGDRLAFRAFYAATAPLLYAYALRLRVSGALAEDVVQDTYLRIWRYARGYDAARGASPTTWAIQILRNRAVDLRVAQGPATTPLDDDTAADAMVGFNTGNAMSERLTACFNNLGGRYRQVLYLSFAQGLSHAEIAAQLDIPLGTAKSLIRRALMELKQRLEPASMAGVSSTVTRGGAVAASVN